MAAVNVAFEAGTSRAAHNENILRFHNRATRNLSLWYLWMASPSTGFTAYARRRTHSVEINLIPQSYVCYLLFPT